MAKHQHHRCWPVIWRLARMCCPSPQWCSQQMTTSFAREDAETLSGGSKFECELGFRAVGIRGFIVSLCESLRSATWEVSKTGFYHYNMLLCLLSVYIYIVLHTFGSAWPSQPAGATPLPARRRKRWVWTWSITALPRRTPSRPSGCGAPVRVRPDSFHRHPVDGWLTPNMAVWIMAKQPPIANNQQSCCQQLLWSVGKPLSNSWLYRTSTSFLSQL